MSSASASQPGPARTGRASAVPAPVEQQIFPDAVAAAVARHLALSPAASMPELAGAAGISRATLFRRYPSRAALVADLCRTATEAYVRAVEEAVTPDGPPVAALGRLLEGLARLAPVVGLLGLQPLGEHVERSLLEQAAQTEDEVRRLVRRGQESGDFRVELDPEWVVTMLTWLMVAAADGVRLGRLTASAAERHFREAVRAAVLRPAGTGSLS